MLDKRFKILNFTSLNITVNTAIRKKLINIHLSVLRCLLYNVVRVDRFHRVHLVRHSIGNHHTQVRTCSTYFRPQFLDKIGFVKSSIFFFFLNKQTTKTGGRPKQHELEGATRRGVDRSQQTLFVSFGSAKAYGGTNDICRHQIDW